VAGHGAGNGTGCRRVVRPRTRTAQTAERYSRMLKRVIRPFSKWKI
jgi:hypothetical protein